MKQDGFGSIFLRHLAMAIPWGIILLVVFVIMAVGIKQQLKEAIQYGVKTTIYEASSYAYNYHTVVPVKQNIKEGVEFVARTARNEVKNLLNDPQVKEDLKELIEHGED